MLVHEVNGIGRTRLDLPETATVADALIAAGLHEISIERVGIFGRPCKADDSLGEGARIEVYRPLLADPKQVRRQRARMRRPAA